MKSGFDNLQPSLRSQGRPRPKESDALISPHTPFRHPLCFITTGILLSVAIIALMQFVPNLRTIRQTGPSGLQGLSHSFFVKQPELAPSGVNREPELAVNRWRAERSMAVWLRVLPWALYGSAALVKVGVPHTLTPLLTMLAPPKTALPPRKHEATLKPFGSGG